MGLLNRKPKPDDRAGGGDDNSKSKNQKGGWRRPANTAFKQQRLKAWQPILTPKTVLPTLFIIGLLFAPIGGLLIWGSNLVSEITFDYTDCDRLQSSSPSSPSFSNLAKYTYRLPSRAAHASINPPQYAFINDSSNSDVTQRQRCVISFDVPVDIKPGVLIYYKLTNFFQNHRRYVKSLDSNQLKGKSVNVHDLNKGDCKPLASLGGKAIYPCGLIANSVFNDSFSNLSSVNDGSTSFNFSQTGIAWPGEAKKYTSTPGYNLSEIVPPPNWALRYPNGYTDSNPPPNLKLDEHFQNWMRTAGLPTFTKLYGRNDHETLTKGRYQITIGLNFPVRPYRGTKSIVISTVSWIGGKNPFLGWAYVATAGVFALLAVAGTIRHLVKPRKLGDMSLLSWNR